MKPGRTGKQSTILSLVGAFLASLLWLCPAPQARAAATKTAISATFAVMADDFWDVYFNGVNIDPGRTANYDGGTSPCYDVHFQCKAKITTFNILPFLNCGGNNVLGVTVYD